MRNLTLEEKQRLWKNDVNPVRKILLWGFDSYKNPCLLILYGQQEFEREIKSSPNSYYVEARLLKPTIVYTNYAVFHGINGHLPSIPNTYYSKDDNLLCYNKGYKTAGIYWQYDRKTGYRKCIDVDEKYIIKEFYNITQKVEFNYYEKNNYKDYVSYLKSRQINFEDFELIDNPNDLFDFELDSVCMETIINIFLKERLYARKKYLKQFIKTQPSVEEYECILNVASVELACGVFQELMMEKNPILLKTAKEIDKSDILWAKREYHNGLKRCLKQYISMFDENLMREQKEFIYKTLPEMDFQIKKLNLNNGVKLEGKELEEYLNRPYIYQNIYVYGKQKLYDKGTYTDGKDIYNIKFKNTIQTAKAYEMADVIGKIAYYLDSPRLVCYFKGSSRRGAYNYYSRYLRRILDEYKAFDEKKFITAAREMLVSYTNNDSLNIYCCDDYFDMNFFFSNYFRDVLVDDTIANNSIWNRYINDVIYIAKNAKALHVHEFCYIILNKAYARNIFDSYKIKELIELSKIPYEKTAGLFKSLLFPKLKTLQEFDSEIMISLMSAQSDDLWNAAKKYFERTNGKFKPENIVDFLFLDTIEIWYSVLEDNINNFTAEEYGDFIKSITKKSENFLEKRIELSDRMIELLKNSVYKLNMAPMEEKQDLLRYFIALLSGLKKMPDFLFEITENIIFFMPYDLLRNTLKDINIQYGKIMEREYNIVSLLKSIKEDSLPKDSVILSVLEIGSSRLVKTITEIIEKLQYNLIEKTTTLLLLFECNVYNLNKIAQCVFENMKLEKREKLHMLLLDSPIERAYQYGLKKLDEWYGNKIPKQFILRMMEHPHVEVKAYLSEKIKKAFHNLKDVTPDLYIYYSKTLLYLPNRVSKGKEYVYSTIPMFLKYYPEKQKDIEDILLDIGSSNSKIDSERALVTFAQIQKEVSNI